ncbi:cytochrome c biogenesis protein CcsA [Luteimonas pelagia]
MTLVLIAVLAYLAATVLLMRTMAVEASGVGRAWLAVAVTGVVLHAVHHAREWQATGVPDLHFFAALSLTGLGMAALTTLFGASGRMAALGVFVFPLAATLLVGDASVATAPGAPMPWPIQLHAWCALLAYAVLAIAALLALLSWAQERALRRHERHRWMRALPPLVELESLLFRTIAVGFVLLTATLLTGVLFVEDMFAQHLAHKTVFSVLSWLAFGVLLLGRWRRGWRGRTAVGWTLAAMALLALAFFGSKFVVELVLGRGVG